MVESKNRKAKKVVKAYIQDFILNLDLQKRKLKWSKTELGGRELN